MVLVLYFVISPVRVCAIYLSFNLLTISRADWSAKFLIAVLALNEVMRSLTASSCWYFVATWRQVLPSQKEGLSTSLTPAVATCIIYVSLIVWPVCAQSQAVTNEKREPSSYCCGVLPLMSF